MKQQTRKKRGASASATSRSTEITADSARSILSEGLLAAHAQLVEMAQDHLDRAGAEIAALPAHLRPAFAPLALLRRQLRRIGTQAENPFSLRGDVAEWRKIAILAWWVWRQR